METKELKPGVAYQLPINAKFSISDGVLTIEYENEEPKFKSGDFVKFDPSDGRIESIAIISDVYNGNIFSEYCVIDGELTDNEFSDIENRPIRLATTEEKQLLIDKLHKIGKDWDEEKLEIVDWTWKPKRGDIYYFIDYDVMIAKWGEYPSDDKHRFFSNLIFRTEELAEEALEMLKNCKHY